MVWATTVCGKPGRWLATSFGEIGASQTDNTFWAAVFNAATPTGPSPLASFAVSLRRRRPRGFWQSSDHPGRPIRTIYPLTPVRDCSCWRTSRTRETSARSSAPPPPLVSPASSSPIKAPTPFHQSACSPAPVAYCQSGCEGQTSIWRWYRP